MKNWLDKYNDGGPVQPNYNDASVSMSKDFVGDGYSNVGRNYSPAWGGQFQDGGQLLQLQPDGKVLDNVTVKGKRQPIVVTDPNDSRLKAYNDSLSLYNSAKDYNRKVYNTTGNAATDKDLRFQPVKDVYPAGTSKKDILKYEKKNLRDEIISEKSMKENEWTNNQIKTYRILNNLAKKSLSTGIMPTGYYSGEGYFPAFKKPTQPVIYEKPKPEPTSQAIIDWIEGNGSSEEFVPEVEQPKTVDGQPFGFVQDIQTGYTHMYRKSTGELEIPFRGGQTHVDPKNPRNNPKPKMAMGGSMPGAVGFTYARTGGIPSNGPYAKKTKASAKDGTIVPGENEPMEMPDDYINYDSENPAFNSASMLFSKDLINSIPEANSPAIDININQRNLGAEHTFMHQPGYSVWTGEPTDNYMLKRTVTPYVTDEDIRLNTQMPTSPRNVNFISNYAGARPDPGSEYPTSVPYEGEKHWNIDRFAIDPQFGSSYTELENADANTDKTQQRRNTLADMYKYFMLQNKGDRDTSWKQANEFMTKEIDPRISGPVYNAIRNDESLVPLRGSITSMIGDDYLRNFNSLTNEANLPEKNRSDVGRMFLKNPASTKQAKDLAMDWLVNYKKMSPKEAETYYKKLPKNEKQYLKYVNSKTKKDKPLYTPIDSSLYPSEGFQNGGEMKYYQNGLDWKPKSISKDGSQLVKLDQLTNFTNYNTKQPGGWLDKYQD